MQRSEVLDIPDIEAQQIQQQRIAALGITISQFQKTLQGRALIERQELFILGGMIYQGYNQKAVECPEDQCTDHEIGNCHDIDGTKQRVLDTRQRRMEGRQNARDKESAERRRGKIAQERDELELQLLKRRIALMDAGEGTSEDPGDETDPLPEPESKPGSSTSTTLPTYFACPVCTKAFKSKAALGAHQRFGRSCSTTVKAAE